MLLSWVGQAAALSEQGPFTQLLIVVGSLTFFAVACGAVLSPFATGAAVILTVGAALIGRLRGSGLLLAATCLLLAGLGWWVPPYVFSRSFGK